MRNADRFFQAPLPSQFFICSFLVYDILPLMQQAYPNNPLSSRDNITVKFLRSLSDPKRRKKEQAFLIEGVKMVEEALRDNLGVKTVVATPSLTQHHGKGVLKLSENKGIGIVWVTDRLMDILAESKTPQPIMAVVQMKQITEELLLKHKARLIVIAHELQDPGNLGTIIRTAEAVGASGIAITANTVDPFNAKAVRASMNSILRLPIVPVGDFATFVRKCRQSGFQTVATALNGEKAHFAVDLTKPTAVIVGREGSGLPQAIMADIDLRVRIPMAETIDSLNVATAAAVVLYEAMRQRLHDSR
jgi:RNA methyltransferase, TrmH family